MCKFTGDSSNSESDVNDEISMNKAEKLRLFSGMPIPASCHPVSASSNRKPALEWFLESYVCLWLMKFKCPT